MAALAMMVVRGSPPVPMLTPVQLCCMFLCVCVADRAAVAQLNYQLIAQDAQVHRSIAQRLITEMLHRLAMHIVTGHAVQVSCKPGATTAHFAATACLVATPVCR